MRSIAKNAAVSFRVNFERLPNDRLELMAEAGAEIVEIYRLLAKTQSNVVGELLRTSGTFYEWDHFPKGDCLDRETQSQYYYHAHRADQRFENEHGHFHTFMRPKGMPAHIKPAKVPNFKPPKGDNDGLCHLITISMDKQGFPWRLFTVNRWVTGEIWYKCNDVIELVDLFNIDHTWPSWPTNRWMTALLRLFQPQIAALLTHRDRVVADWTERFPEKDTFEDRELEICSYVDISVEDQVRAVGRALLARQDMEEAG